MVLLQNISISDDKYADIRAWIEVIAIIISPIITILIWQLNVRARKWRAKMDIVAKLPSYLTTYGAYFLEIERNELNFQLFSFIYLLLPHGSEKENYRNLVLQARETGNELQSKLLKISGDISTLCNKLPIYSTKRKLTKKSKEIIVNIGALSDIKARKFENQFLNMSGDQASQLHASLLAKIVEEYKTIHIGKKIDEIISLIRVEYYNKKENRLTKGNGRT